MRVLFDHCTPRGLARALKGHEVTEARDRGWDKETNGELIALAEQYSFDVLVTPDKNIRYQQNLNTRTIALVIIGNPQWPILRHHVERVVAAVDQAVPGSYCEITIPRLKRVR
jgi:hypothetical protein